MNDLTTREELEIIRKGQGYQVNPRLRQKVLERLGYILDDDEESVRNHLAAAETLLKVELLELQRSKMFEERDEATQAQAQIITVALPMNGTEST